METENKVGFDASKPFVVPILSGGEKSCEVRFPSDEEWCAWARAQRTVSKRLSASVLSALYSFWVSQNAGLTPFAFYNPFDVASGQQIGGNYDPTGNNTQGRVTVAFRGNWAQATDIARTSVQVLELAEIA
jgi:hypothetical protein